jgi:hypothetical protein
VSYVVLGGGSFYDNPTVVGILRWVQAAMAVAAAQDPFLDEVLAFPPRNIDLGRLRGDDIAIRLSAAGDHPELREVAGLLRRVSIMKPAGAVAAVIKEAGIERWASTQTLDGRKVMRVAENLAEEAAGFDGLGDFIQYMEAMRGREKGARCFITTIHGSKGLSSTTSTSPLRGWPPPHDKGDIQEGRAWRTRADRARDRLVILVPGKIGGNRTSGRPSCSSSNPPQPERRSEHVRQCTEAGH